MSMSVRFTLFEIGEIYAVSYKENCILKTKSAKNSKTKIMHITLVHGW